MRGTTTTLGERIKGHRRRLKLTQQQVADQMGVSIQAVSQWETDKTAPEITRLEKLAELYGVSATAILGGMDIAQGLRERNRKNVPLLRPYDMLRMLRYEYPPIPAEATWIETSLDIRPLGFAFEIEDHSNAPLFFPGDVVICSTVGWSPTPGDMVISSIYMEDDVTLSLEPDLVGMDMFNIGKFRQKLSDESKRVTEIAPLNQDYPSIIWADDQPGSVIGIIVEHRRFRKPERLLSAR